MSAGSGAGPQGRPRVHVLTNIPSYHQVDLFDAISRSAKVELFVTYLRRMTPGRQWKTLPTPRHPHRFMPVRFDRGALYFNPGIGAQLKAIPCDVLVVTQYAGLSYQYAMWSFTHSGRNWVFWSESPGVRLFEVSSGIPELMRPMVRRVAMAPLRRAKGVWGIGRRAAAEYQVSLGRQCSSLPYYSDLTRFERRDADYAPGGTVRFLYAGRYSYRKGFDILCDAFARLHARRPESKWTLSVCGDGDLRTLLARNAEMACRVRQLGFQELDAMPAVMRGHDVFVFPTRYDGWGMVVPEALGSGLLVLSSDAAGSAIDVGEVLGGLRLFPSGSVERLADLLQEVVDDPPDWAAVGTAAATAARRYDATQGAHDFSEMVRGVMRREN